MSQPRDTGVTNGASVGGAGVPEGGARVPSAVMMRAPLTLDDVLKDLLWPRMLRSAGLALNASRIGLALMIVVIVMMLDSLGRVVFGGSVGIIASAYTDIVMSAMGVVRTAAEGEPDWAVQQLHQVFIELPRSLLLDRPLHTLFVLLPAIAIGAILGGAICRSAACESAVNVRLTWMQSLGFALSRWSSLVGATLGPLAMIWVTAGFFWLIGWGFKVFALDIVASIVFGFGLIAALVAAMGMLVYFLGQSMLVPGVACEGSDGFDSVQRAYAYTIARPGRLTIYSLIAIAQGFVGVSVAMGLVMLAGTLATNASGLGLMLPALLSSVMLPVETSGTLHIAQQIATFFFSVLLAIVAAYGVSFYYCACTQLYLVMRQLVDGQDIGELWMPGVVDGSLARADAPTPLTGGVSFAQAGVSRLDRSVGEGPAS